MNAQATLCNVKNYQNWPKKRSVLHAAFVFSVYLLLIISVHFTMTQSLFMCSSLVEIIVHVASHRFHSLSSFLQGNFTYSILPGFLYKFKIGIYNEYGLIGTKLDNLRNRTFGRKRMQVIKKVPRHK